jgi:hypothetical protein
MCRNISSDVHELARRQRETDDNLRRLATSMGIPFAPRSPDMPLHAPPLEINEWHQQTYGVPFMTTEDEEAEAEEFFDDRDQFVPPPHQGDPGPSSSYPPPRILPVALLPQLTLGRKTLQSIWRHDSLIHPLPSDLCLFLFSCFFGASCQKGGEGLMA